MGFIAYSYGVGESWFSSRSRAEQHVREHGGEIIDRSQVYQVGDRVEVQAYGAWRPGRVMDWGRRRVWVKFYSRVTRKRELRSFSSVQIRPRGWTP